MIEIRLCNSKDGDTWDKYVERHPSGTFYHLYNWRHIIKNSYGHEPYYLIAEKKDAYYPDHKKLCPAENVVGVLPIFFIKPPVSNGALVSLPFVDFAGVIADSTETERELVKAVIQVGIDEKVKYIELRTATKQGVNGDQKKTKETSVDSTPIKWNVEPFKIQSKDHKVRMLMDLPDSSEVLMTSFKSKLRSQIKKPIKAGLKTQTGGIELLKDFYTVFSKNMRDLGSPVHSKHFIGSVLNHLCDNAKIVLVYNDAQPVAGSILIGHKNIIVNPWASALQECKHLSPNMLLYWAMLEYACDNGFAIFDFGRSSPGSGTYRFKQQWGARPHPLCWQYIYLNGAPGKSDDITKSSLAETVVNAWKKLPVKLTTLIGPPIRKYITL